MKCESGPPGGDQRSGDAAETVLLACHTIRMEIEKAARETGRCYPTVWIESGLHLQPESLRGRIQEELDRLNHARRVILGFGFCGNAVVGLVSGDFELVVPRVDDCITLLLGSRERRDACLKDGGVYFLTQGWLEDELNIWKEYQATLARLGPERTDRAYRLMLAHYRYLGLIDSGAYDLSALLPRVREIGARLHLEPRVLPGSDAWLKRLLTGPWQGDGFVIVPPHTRVDLALLGFDADTPAPVPQVQPRPVLPA